MSCKYRHKKRAKLLNPWIFRLEYVSIISNYAISAISSWIKSFSSPALWISKIKQLFSRIFLTLSWTLNNLMCTLFVMDIFWTVLNIPNPIISIFSISLKSIDKALIPFSMCDLTSFTNSFTWFLIKISLCNDIFFDWCKLISLISPLVPKLKIRHKMLSTNKILSNLFSLYKYFFIFLLTHAPWY